MKITVQQLHVLDNLHRVVMRRKVGGRLTHYLDNEDCGSKIFSLAARGLVAIDSRGVATRVGDPDGIIGVPVRKQATA